MSDVLGKRHNERHDSTDEHIKTETMLRNVLASVKQLDEKYTAQGQQHGQMLQQLGGQMVELFAAISEVKGVAATAKALRLDQERIRTAVDLNSSRVRLLGEDLDDFRGCGAIRILREKTVCFGNLPRLPGALGAELSYRQKQHSMAFVGQILLQLNRPLVEGFGGIDKVLGDSFVQIGKNSVQLVVMLPSVLFKDQLQACACGRTDRRVRCRLSVRFRTTLHKQALNSAPEGTKARFRDGKAIIGKRGPDSVVWDRQYLLTLGQAAADGPIELDSDEAPAAVPPGAAAAAEAEAVPATATGAAAGPAAAAAAAAPAGPSIVRPAGGAAGAAAAKQQAKDGAATASGNKAAGGQRKYAGRVPSPGKQRAATGAWAAGGPSASAASPGAAAAAAGASQSKSDEQIQQWLANSAASASKQYPPPPGQQQQQQQQQQQRQQQQG
jgi:hypothetical protein